MKSSDLYLFCFAVGTVWTVVTMLLGTMHVGHGPSAHTSFHGHASHQGHSSGACSGGRSHLGHWLASVLNPNSLAIFLAWFGGIGYLLTRHSGLAFWMDLAVAALCGTLGAYLLAIFLGFLQAHEKPMNPADYEIVGVLGRVSSTIRPDGVGELIYSRDGVRRPVCARSEDGTLIGRDTEVVVTRYEKGVAYVRTFDSMLAMRDLAGLAPGTQSLDK